MNEQVKLLQALEQLVEAVESTDNNPFTYRDRVDDALDKAHSVLESNTVEELRNLCATAYQVVGAASGPVKLLDNLYAAAIGNSLPHDTGAGLAWTPKDDSEWNVVNVEVEHLNFDSYEDYSVPPKTIRLTIKKEKQL